MYAALARMGEEAGADDVLVVAQKIVSKAEGRALEIRRCRGFAGGRSAFATFG